MTYNELNQMTVLQLRKLAKENSVVLGSGIDKAGIIDKLLPVLSDDAWRNRSTRLPGIMLTLPGTAPVRLIRLPEQHPALPGRALLLPDSI